MSESWKYPSMWNDNTSEHYRFSYPPTLPSTNSSGRRDVALFFDTTFCVWVCCCWRLLLFAPRVLGSSFYRTSSAHLQRSCVPRPETFVCGRELETETNGGICCVAVEKSLRRCSSPKEVCVPPFGSCAPFLVVGVHRLSSPKRVAPPPPARRLWT